MVMYIWDKYGSNEINDKIKYWADLWDDLIANFNKKSYGLELINPQLLISDIIDEIMFNDFRNEDNRKYFNNKLEYFLKYDPAIKKYFRIEFSKIRRMFNDDKFLLLQACKETQNIFESGEYFRKSQEILSMLLIDSNNGNDDKKNINIITRNLIIDLILKGYSIKTIKKIPKNIFDKYYFQGGQLVTDFPHDVDISYFEVDGEYDWEAYFNTLKVEIDNIALEDRLNKLLKYYFTKPKELYIIFQIEGLKGDIDISIGNVNFYSPNIKKYIIKGYGKDEEHEFFSSAKDQYFLNAAVKVNSIDTNASSLIAIEEIEKSLDILKCFYKTESTFEIIRERYLVTDSEGRQMGESLTVSQRLAWYRWREALDLNENTPSIEMIELFDNIGGYIFKSSDKQSLIENRITHSVHWFRKGEEAKKAEDKLVNYWIVIENLLDFKISLKDSFILGKQNETKFTLAKELIPFSLVLGYIYNVGWELYYYVTQLLGSSQGFRKLLDIPEHILDECNLNPKPGTTVFLSTFVNNLPKLIDEVDREIIKEKLIYVYKFYTDEKFTLEEIELFISNLRNELLLIYRYRNKIVHNGHYDNVILPYFVQKARKIASNILREVITSYKNNSQQSLEEIFTQHRIKVENFIEKLKNNISVDIFNIKL